jgi:hypothetical protein
VVGAQHRGGLARGGASRLLRREAAGDEQLEFAVGGAAAEADAGIPASLPTTIRPPPPAMAFTARRAS